MKFPQAVESRLSKLLHMEYTLKQLSNELVCDKDLLKRAIAYGCPCRKSGNGILWLVGDEVSAWYTRQKAEGHVELAPNEAFCVACRQPVKIQRPRQVSGKRVNRLVGKCSKCGSTVNRYKSRREDETASDCHDQSE